MPNHSYSKGTLRSARLCVDRPDCDGATEGSARRRSGSSISFASYKLIVPKTRFPLRISLSGDDERGSRRSAQPIWRTVTRNSMKKGNVAQGCSFEILFGQNRLSDAREDRSADRRNRIRAAAKPGMLFVRRYACRPLAG